MLPGSQANEATRRIAKSGFIAWSSQVTRDLETLSPGYCQLHIAAVELEAELE